MSQRKALQELMKLHGLSQSQVATQIGKSTATVNQYLQGLYSGNNKAIDTAVIQLIERYKTKKTHQKLEFIATQTATNIMNLAELTHSVGDISLVIGDAGLGKTMALKHYAKGHEDVVFIEVTPTFNVKVLLTALCDKLGVMTSKNNNDMMLSICQKLMNSERLIIIDEAELLTHKSLEILRRIHDLAGVGLVLAGMPRLRANLRGKNGEFKQLYSRIGYCEELGNSLPNEELEQLASAAIGTDEFSADIAKQSLGNARRLGKITAGLKRYCEIAGENISQEMIKQFASKLIS